MNYLSLAIDSLPKITEVYDFECDPGYSTGNSISSAFLELTLVDAGSWDVEYSESGYRYPIETGQIKVYPDNTLRNATATASCRHKHSTIYIRNTTQQTIMSEDQFRKHAMILKSQKSFPSSGCRLVLPLVIDLRQYNNLANTFRDIIKTYRSGGIYSIPNASAMLLKLLTSISELYINKFIPIGLDASRRSCSITQKLLEYINDNYTSINSVDDIAHSFSYNSSYLSTVFKKDTGYNIVEYINRLSVVKASELICSSSLSFQEVAGMVGISNIYYFYRLFKKYTGITMGEYSKLSY